MPDDRSHPLPDTALPAEPKAAPLPKEYGGPKGPDPVRYSDWTIGGKCVDF